MSLNERLASLTLASNNEHGLRSTYPAAEGHHDVDDGSVDVVQLRGLKALELDVLRMPTDGSSPGSSDFEDRGGVRDDWQQVLPWEGPFRTTEEVEPMYLSIEELANLDEPASCELALEVQPHRVEASDCPAGFENTVQSGRSFVLVANLLSVHGEPIVQHPHLELRASLVFHDDHSPAEDSCDSPPLKGETHAVVTQGAAFFRLKICATSYHHNRRRFCILVQSTAASWWHRLEAFSQPLRSVARLEKQHHAEHLVATASSCAAFSSPDVASKTDVLHELEAMQTHLQINADKRQLLRQESGAHEEQLGLLMQQQQEILKEVALLRSSMMS